MPYIILNKTKEIRIRKKLRNKYIKLYGYDKKIILDSEIDRFLKDKKTEPSINELNNLDLIIKKVILQSLSKHRKKSSEKLNLRDKILKNCHYDLLKNKNKNKNYNKEVLNYTNQEWDNICIENDKLSKLEIENEKILKKKKILQFKRTLDIQTGKVILKNKSTSIHKKTNNFKKFHEKTIKEKLDQIKDEEIKKLNLKKEQVKETKNLRDINNLKRNEIKTKYKTILTNNNQRNNEKLIPKDDYEKLIDEVANKRYPKKVKYYEDHRAKKEIKFSETFKNKIKMNEELEKRKNEKI